jgi:uracil-DNA glycosylase family 4
MLEPIDTSLNKDTEMSLDDIYRDYQKDEAFKHLRTQPGVKFVPGTGPLEPEIMLIGEAPGRMENAKRIPFSGSAGEILSGILETVDIDYSKVFMTNVIKYWPQEPDNPGKTRTPTDKELTSAREYVLDEIDVVNPLLVGLCGNSALRTIYPEKRGIYRWRGKLIEDTYVVLYHPALLGYRPEKRPLVLSSYFDLKKHLEKARMELNND